MKVTIILVLTLVSCTECAFLFSSGCTADTECLTHGCCVKGVFGNTCKQPLGVWSQCKLQTASGDSCDTLCVDGLTCMEDPAVHTTGYGRCHHGSVTTTVSA